MIHHLTKHAWRVFAILIALAIVAIALLGIPAQAGAAKRPICKNGTIETVVEGVTRQCVNGRWVKGPPTTALPSKTKVKR